MSVQIHVGRRFRNHSLEIGWKFLADGALADRERWSMLNFSIDSISALSVLFAHMCHADKAFSTCPNPSGQFRGETVTFCRLLR